MHTIKPQNVMYRSTNPGHNHIQYKIMQWHDRRCPHASQWPKPTYQHWLGKCKIGISEPAFGEDQF